MNPVAEALEELISLGVEGAALVAAIRRIETAAYEQRIRSLEETIDRATAQADASRLKERDRKRAYREGKASVSQGQDGTSGDVRETPLLDKEIPPTPPKEINPPHADASSERASEAVWAERLAEAKAIGAGLDLTVPAMHVHRDLRLLVEPEVGTPCTWPEVLDAIRIEAAKAKTRGKPIRSWSWVKDTAIGLRDRRLNGLPPVEQSHGRQQSPATGHPRTSHQLEKLADVDAAMRAAVRN